MRTQFLSGLTTSSTLADLPGCEDALELGDRGKALGDYFHRHPTSPGVLLTEKREFRTAISRRYYLGVIGRYCGMDLYHPRPIQFMLSRLEELGGPLIVDAGLPIQEAVRLGLERPRELVYEPLLVRFGAPSGSTAGAARLGVRLVDFEDLLAADSRLTSLRSAQMRQILETVREGLLLVDRDRRIAPEYADAVEEILGVRGIAGRVLDQVLLEILPAEVASVTADYLEALFDPKVIESLVAGINPLLRVEARCAGRRKVLSVRFARSLEAGRVRHVLVRIEDVTREDDLAREVEAQRRRAEERLELALSLVQCDPEGLGQLLLEVEARRHRAAELFASVDSSLVEQVPSGALEALARELHAAKGEAAMLGLKSIAAAIHALEQPLVEVREKGAVDARLAVEVRGRVALLGSVADEARGVLDQFARLGRRLSPTPLSPTPLSPTPLSPTSIAPTPIAALLEESERFVADLGRELGKPCRLLWRIGEPELVMRRVPLLRDLLVQLSRNSLVHGIEAAEVRRQLGKPEVGAIQFVARPRQGWVEWIFQDDGGGLDLARIEAVAEAQGLLAARSASAELAQLIFRPGFSTADAVSLHAGRGVGLDLVRERVEAEGGRVTVHSQPGSYCAIQVLLPSTPSEALA